MIPVKKHARRAAQWIVDSVMGNGLAQQENAHAEINSADPQVAQLCLQAAADGCVLLTNDGTLPLLADDEVAVFGRCQLDWFHMGYGSGGDVNPAFTTNLIDGLSAVGAQYNRVLAEMYRGWCTSAEHQVDRGWWGHWPTSYPEMPVASELVHAAAQTASTAIVVIGRSAGEDLDMPLSKGGYYLTDDEQSLLEMTGEAFDHTVVVINSGNIIDFSWIERLGNKISAVLLAWQGGMQAGAAVANVLYGKVSPTGRLAATIARTYDDYPSSASFGVKGQVEYSEGIFVGYRHFDTHAPQSVLFPFGHGLSYTTFLTEILSAELRDNSVYVRVRVVNTGDVESRKTVLLWCQQPVGNLKKPARVLVAFGKTDVLEPGGNEELTLTCDLMTLASYDEAASAFVLEPGTYQFDCTRTATSLEIEKRMVVEQCSPICLGTDELRERISNHLPREIQQQTGGTISFEEVKAGTASLDDFVAQLNDDELETLTCGEGLMNSSLGTPGNAGALGGVTSDLRSKGIPAAICADGPSGARLQRRCSLLPCAIALACTWDTSLVQKLYAALGAEVRANGVDILLAPGMNIQRNPRCGRNFEYFSEDPLASGRMAAAVVRGLQSAGISACPKHFACNNQEMRRNTSDSRVSEQALREIYLRGFQICVREARPDFVMTSYNKVNGAWAHYNYDLATTVLRNEWGFEGVVITDWWMKPARSPEFPDLQDNAYRLRAGVDVLMPGSMSHVLLVRSKARNISRGELQQSARRVLKYLLNRKMG